MDFDADKLLSQATREAMEYRLEHPRDDFEPMLRAVYRCAEPNRDSADFLKPPKCDFEDVRRLIRETAAVRRVDPDGFCQQTIDRLEAEPMEFLPHSTKGFRFQKLGFDLLEMQRADAPEARVWGWLDWQNVRRRQKELERGELVVVENFVKLMWSKLWSSAQ